MINNIRLQQFRSYGDMSFEFTEGVTIIVGPNASGKTNLLEAVLCLCHGSSYRTRSDADLVKNNTTWARISAIADKKERDVKLEKQGDSVKKSFVLDGQTYSRLSLAKTMPVVLFEPNHLRLITGGPDLRRDYIDGILEQTLVGYTTTLRHYKRVLAQRNALLKKGHKSAIAQLFAWNLRLAELGGQLIKERSRLIDDMNASASDTYSRLADSPSDITIRYVSSCPTANYETELLKKLEASVATDVIRGFTGVGPHRDDVAITINNQPASVAASRGETRTLLLMLKVGELNQLEKARGIKPVLLLDDVFSELDGKRRQALTKYLDGYQTFITTTDADIVVQHFLDHCQVIPLSMG